MALKNPEKYDLALKNPEIRNGAPEAQCVRPLASARRGPGPTTMISNFIKHGGHNGRISHLYKQYETKNSTLKIGANTRKMIIKMSENT